MGVGWSDGELLSYLRGKGFKDEQIKASGLAKEHEVENRKVLLDFFRKDFAIFPHFSSGKVLHFTMKDPSKKVSYQLPKTARAKDWKFYNQDALSKFNEIIEKNPASSVVDDAYFELAKIYVREGNLDKTKEILTKIITVYKHSDQYESAKNLLEMINQSQGNRR